MVDTAGFRGRDKLWHGDFKKLLHFLLPHPLTPHPRTCLLAHSPIHSPIHPCTHSFMPTHPDTQIKKKKKCPREEINQLSSHFICLCWDSGPVLTLECPIQPRHWEAPSLWGHGAVISEVPVGIEFKCAISLWLNTIAKGPYSLTQHHQPCPAETHRHTTTCIHHPESFRHTDGEKQR